MAISLPRRLPAARVLAKEGLAVREHERGADGGGLGIAMLNLMPKKESTEIQIARMLADGPADVSMSFFVPEGHTPKTVGRDHIENFYETWADIRGREFDGLIVTGAPIETLPFEEVTYWAQLCEVFEWAQRRVAGGYYICWAAQAALNHFHGVPKYELDAKMFGVFAHRIDAPESDLVRGMAPDFELPVSRHTEVRGEDLPRGAVRIVAQSARSGVGLLEEPARGLVYNFNHPEYDAMTLRDEYVRDVDAGAEIQLPENYFPDDDPDREPTARWREKGRLIYRNWLARLAEARGAEPTARKAG